MHVEQVEVLKLPSVICHVSSLKQSLSSISDYTLKTQIKALLRTPAVLEKYVVVSSAAARIEYFYDTDTFVSDIHVLDGKTLFISNIEVRLSISTPSPLPFDNEFSTYILHKVPGKLLQLNIASEPIESSHALWDEVTSKVGMLKAMETKTVSSHMEDIPLYVDVYMKFSSKADKRSVHTCLMQYNNHIILQKADKYYVVDISYDVSNYMSSSAIQHRQATYLREQEVIEEVIYWRDSCRRLLEHMNRDADTVWADYLNSDREKKHSLRQSINDTTSILHRINRMIDCRNAVELTKHRGLIEDRYYDVLDINADMQRSVSEYNERIAAAKRQEQIEELQRMRNNSRSALQMCVDNICECMQNLTELDCSLSSSITLILRQILSHIATAKKLLARKSTPLAALQTSQQMIEIEFAKINPYFQKIRQYCSLVTQAAELKHCCELYTCDNNITASNNFHSFLPKQLESLLQSITDSFACAETDITCLDDMSLTRHTSMVRWLRRACEVASLCFNLEREWQRLQRIRFARNMSLPIEKIVIQISGDAEKAWTTLSHRWEVLITSGDDVWDTSLVDRMVRMLDRTLWNAFAVWEQVECNLMTLEDEASAALRAIELETKQIERKHELDEVYWMTVEDKRSLVLRKIDRLLKRKAVLIEEVESGESDRFMDRWKMDCTTVHHAIEHNDSPALLSVTGYVSIANGMEKEEFLRKQVAAKRKHRVVSLC